MNSFTRARRSVVGMPAPVLVAVGVAWALAFAVEAAGLSGLMAHDRLLDGAVPIAEAVVVQLAGWAAMVVAMMLPTAVPLLRLFRGAAAGQERPGAATAALVGGYLLVWMGFGALAFGLDVVLHALVESSAVLHSAEWAIGGTTLAVAGLFQFSALKDACLQECRHPAAFLLRYYQRDVRGGLLMGIRHGVFCVGCCWALMLVMFAVGVSNLVWMAVLTAVMVNEKTRPGGRRSVPVTGVELLGAAAIVWANAAHAAGLLS